MTAPLALGLDVGSGSVRALLLDRRGRCQGTATVPLRTVVHRHGAIDLDAEQVLKALGRAVRQLFAQSRATPSQVQGLGLACQRSTSVLFSATTGDVLAPAISWQCRRTEARVAGMAARRRRILQRDTGLPVLPHYAASKLQWLWNQGRGKDRQVGTLDAFLAARLTREQEAVTDLSMASRTLLVNLGQRRWSTRNARWFGLQHARLPRLVPTLAACGTLRTRVLSPLPAGLPILARAGDQQAALFATGLRPGAGKITYGSGAFLLAPCGTTAPTDTDPRLLRSVAYQRADQVHYLLESNVPSSGTTVEWLSRLVGRPFDALLRAAARRPGKVGTGQARAGPADPAVFLPALAGLGPHAPGAALGVIADLDLATTPEDLAVALAQGIGALLADGVEQVEAHLGRRLRPLQVDGGGSQDVRFLQHQSDLLRRPLHRARNVEATAHGAAAMAWRTLGEVLPPLGTHARPIRPGWSAARARRLRRRLRELVNTARPA